MNTLKWALLGAMAATGVIVHAQSGEPAHGHGHHQAASRHNKTGGPFNAKHVRKSATITLHGDIDTVWPLFDPINESKWAAAWKPEMIHPQSDVVAEGMVFKVHETVWIVSRYDARNHRITYVVNHPEKIHTIDVQCEPHSASLTNATITYSYVGLTEVGNKLVKRAAEKMYAHELKDWQAMLNHYLETGQTMPAGAHGEHRGHGHGGHQPGGTRDDAGNAISTRAQTPETEPRTRPSNAVAVVTVWAEAGDITATARFYEDTLGLRRVGDSTTPYVFDTDGTFIVIMPGRLDGPTNAQRKWPLFALAVPNLDAAVRELRRADVELPWGIEEFGSPDPSSRYVLFRDPAGNLIEIVEWL